MTDHLVPNPAGKMRRRLRTLTIVGALSYPLALVGVIIALRYVGEQSWLALVAMYLPRIGFAMPLPFVVVAIRLWGPRTLLPLQLLSLLLVVFPLMGLNLGTGRLAARAPGAVMRVVSLNVNYGSRGAAAVAAHVRQFAPDVVLLQEATVDFGRDSAAAFEGWNVHLDGQFFVASRFPIRDVMVPPSIVYARGIGGAHFVRYTLQTPLGAVDVFNMHTTSPREGLEELRGNGVRYEITSGRLFGSTAREGIEFNAYRRRRQVEGLAAAAAASPHAVIIAGDTNLPGLSWILGGRLGSFRDAFDQAGLGFGYTYPATRPWMRIDRILTNLRLRATDFRVAEAGVSDHLCVFAVIAAD
jgi:endonuclease/exonuclease/phosphatase family metal-dependent hydrolase